MARPSEYEPSFCQEAEKLCQGGATDMELAEHFGVSDRTIYRWKAQFPEFCQALKAAKEVADERVERSLYHKAVGYTFDSVKIFQYEGSPVEVPFKEHVPPDTTAAIFWLKNRQPDKWRDRREHELTGKDGGPVQMAITQIQRVIVDGPANPDSAGISAASGAGEI